MWVNIVITGIPRRDYILNIIYHSFGLCYDYKFITYICIVYCSKLSYANVMNL